MVSPARRWLQAVVRLRHGKELDFNGHTPAPLFRRSDQAKRRIGREALRVSVDAALRAAIFKASGSIDPMGLWDERER